MNFREFEKNDSSAEKTYLERATGFGSGEIVYL